MHTCALRHPSIHCVPSPLTHTMGRGRGRGGGRGGKRQRGGGNGGQSRSVRPRTDAWRRPEDIESNGLFEEYYREQGVCPPEEWDAFVMCLKTPLPITFRINGRGQFADRLRKKLETDFMGHFADGETLMIDGEPAEPPHPLSWYPGRLAWQMNFSRAQLRKQPVLEALHEFMKRENETGSITRQEAVSMVPPLFLDVEPHHWVLDMCAAPGSKTFQLLEMLHGGPVPATGLVVANDADAMRCNLLSHQTKRMCSPHLVVTNHEAQAFPLLRNLAPDSNEKHVLFDRILCDVPCSGDGTMRKAPDIWRRWNTTSGNALHTLQLRITLRACELLRLGSRLVYSTCTFNPVEDEAVVAEVLRRTKGAFELVDGSDHLPGLKRMPGMQRWRVKDREGWYDSWEQGKQGYKLDQSMFPDEASDALPLHLCMRFLPHHQNTGGFFVAVLRKVRELDGPLEQGSLHHRGKERKQQQQQQQGDEEEEKQEGQDEGPAAEDGAVAVAAAEEVEAAAVDGADAEPMEAVGEQQPGEEAAAEAAEGAGEAEEEAGEGGKGSEGGKGYWQRKREVEADAQMARGLPEWGTVRGGGGRNRQGGGRFRGIDPIVPYVNASQLAEIRAFYGLAPDCTVPESLIARSVEPHPKKLYCVGPAAKLLLRIDVREQLKITGAGVKILERQDSRDGLVPCLYRFAQDGLPVLLPHVTRQRFHPTVEELAALLEHRLVGLPDSHRLHMTKDQPKKKEEAKVEEMPAAEAVAEAGAEPATEPAAEEAAEPTEQAQTKQQQDEAAIPAAGDAALQEQQEEQKLAKQMQPQPRFFLADIVTLEQLQSVAMGCCVALMRAEDVAELGFEPEGGADGGLSAAALLAVACWRGRGNVNVLVSKQEAAQLIEKIRDHRAKAVAAAVAAQRVQEGQPATAAAEEAKEEQLVAA